MTFLAYRFIPAALLVALIFRKRLKSLGPARSAVRARHGSVPHRRLRLPDARPREDECLERRLHHGSVRGAHADLRSAVLASEGERRRVDRSRGCNTWALSLIGSRRLQRRRCDGRADGVFLRLPHPRHRPGRGRLRPRCAAGGPTRRVRGLQFRRRGGAGRSRDARLVGRVERAHHHVGLRQRPRVLRPDLRTEARLAEPDRADPRQRTGLRRTLRLLAGRRSPCPPRSGSAPP